ncbi:hypothetical protein H5410_035520 [Solanum commersonii]|uniref:Uncharacterized protein n=1 Tax=Solanum commersonii TaxID=4109 RepID=A0A9J5Y3Z7_SOLCO|nr:hypothetical protein H5410_035520 [Solanum commersonii]
MSSFPSSKGPLLLKVQVKKYLFENEWHSSLYSEPSPELGADNVEGEAFRSKLGIGGDSPSKQLRNSLLLMKPRFCADELFKHFVRVPTYDEDTQIICKLCSNCYFCC